MPRLERHARSPLKCNLELASKEIERLKRSTGKRRGSSRAGVADGPTSRAARDAGWRTLAWRQIPNHWRGITRLGCGCSVLARYCTYRLIRCRLERRDGDCIALSIRDAVIEAAS
jgi:hypothetical protein